jgi:UDP-N-acetylmuramoyl-L-alanyl-D-glutamate--2,6-diaminopimelate ligase
MPTHFPHVKHSYNAGRMDFLELLDGAEYLAQQGNPQIAGLDYDSRRVRPGWCFVAIRGETTDGNQYIDAALHAGAVAVVSDSVAPRPDVAWAQVPHGRRALARLSANFYGRPAELLSITGITGTNGKTTTAFILDSMLRAAERKAVLVGTVEYRIGEEVLPAPHTTPEALELNQLFARAVEAGCSEAVMEVSSHALQQQRVYGVPFDVAVFTNLTRDHLDYHGTMEEYFASKTILFTGSGTEPPRVAVINLEDEHGQGIVKLLKNQQELITYGIDAGDFHAKNLSIETSGTKFTLMTPTGQYPIWNPLLGRVNVLNLIAASAAAYARSVEPSAIALAADELAQVPGRFQRVDEGQPFTVIVDYAHTDDALRNLTAVARDFLAQRGGQGRVITVFGCGGDRDRSKRPLMGEAAGAGSYFVVLTSDNPRSENPLDIMNDALPGLQRSGTRYTLEPDRSKAITLALHEAAPGDIVLIAGKGHEKVQVTAAGSIPFDDIEVARIALRNNGYANSQPMRSAKS